VLFAFILLYIFNLLSLQRQHPLLWSESELTIPGTKVHIRSSKPLFPGAKFPGNFRSREQMFPLGTFVPGTDTPSLSIISPLYTRKTP